jgi:hypothetical protein
MRDSMTTFRAIWILPPRNAPEVHLVPQAAVDWFQLGDLEIRNGRQFVPRTTRFARDLSAESAADVSRLSNFVHFFIDSLLKAQKN